MVSMGLNWSEWAVEVPKKSFWVIFYRRKGSYKNIKLSTFQSKF